MSWSGGHSGHRSGYPPTAPWGPPLPPGPSYRHSQLSSSNHEHDRQAAARRRKEERIAAAEEQKRKAGMMVDGDLFAPPSRTVRFVISLLDYNACNSELSIVAANLEQMFLLSQTEFMIHLLI